MTATADGFPRFKTAPAEPKPRKPLRRTRLKTRIKPSPLLQQWREAHKDALCELRGAGVADCWGRATDPSHTLPRSLGRDDSDTNLVPLCRPCHDWVEGHAEEAKRLGFAKGRWKP